MQALSIPGEWRVPDSPWFSVSPPHLPLSLRRSANHVQWHRNVSIVFNEISIVTGEAQEASDILDVLRLRPNHYRTRLMLLGVDAILVNVKDAIINSLMSPGAFARLALRPCSVSTVSTSRACTTCSTRLRL